MQQQWRTTLQVTESTLRCSFEHKRYGYRRSWQRQGIRINKMCDCPRKPRGSHRTPRSASACCIFQLRRRGLARLPAVPPEPAARTPGGRSAGIASPVPEAVGAGRAGSSCPALATRSRCGAPSAIIDGSRSAELTAKFSDERTRIRKRWMQAGPNGANEPKRPPCVVVNMAHKRPTRKRKRSLTQSVGDRCSRSDCRTGQRRCTTRCSEWGLVWPSF